MNSGRGESDAELYIKFFARCLIGLGVPSFFWAVYISTFYSVDFQAGLTRLGVTFSMVAAGLILLALLPGGVCSKRRSKRYKSQSEYYFIGGRIDGLMLFLSIPAVLGMGILVASGIVAYRNSASGNSQFDSVKVKIDSVEIKHVPHEGIGEEVLLKGYNFPERYIDLWIACGSVTILELNGSKIEPKTCPAIFSYPKIHSAGRRRSYICHYKMDAEMDSELYHVGETRDGWIRRDDPEAGVLFTRASDKVLRETLIVAALFLITCSLLSDANRDRKENSRSTLGFISRNLDQVAFDSTRRQATLSLKWRCAIFWGVAILGYTQQVYFAPTRYLGGDLNVWTR